VTFSSGTAICRAAMSLVATLALLHGYATVPLQHFVSIGAAVASMAPSEDDFPPEPINEDTDMIAAETASATMEFLEGYSEEKEEEGLSNLLELSLRANVAKGWKSVGRTAVVSFGRLVGKAFDKIEIASKAAGAAYGIIELVRAGQTTAAIQAARSLGAELAASVGIAVAATAIGVVAAAVLGTGVAAWRLPPSSEFLHRLQTSTRKRRSRPQ
jgi:hypothetical protein